MKKVIVFGGGTGLSCLLSGLKLFPVEVTTVITVSDNGSSTGVLKQEFDIPAVGDVGKVLLSMANVDDDFVKLLRYRFHREGSSLDNHPVRNILLTALIDLKGNLTEATRYMSRLLNIKGEVLPLLEERVELVGRDEAGNAEFYGEEDVSRNIRSIASLAYDHDVHVGKRVREKIGDADLIIFSPGSLYTSILPHLIVDDVVEAIRNSGAPIMYVSNLVTQPGETDGYNVSDHLRVLNSYLQGGSGLAGRAGRESTEGSSGPEESSGPERRDGRESGCSGLQGSSGPERCDGRADGCSGPRERKVDIVVANNAEIAPEITEKYLRTEQKTLVRLDREKIAAQGARIMEGDIFELDEEGRIRHNALRTAYMIFSWLMEG